MGELLTAKSSAVAKIKDELHLLEENDPNVNGSSTVSRDVLDSLLYYAETLKEREKRKELNFHSAVLVDTMQPAKAAASSSQIIFYSEFYYGS